MTTGSAIADLIAAQGACDPVLKDATNPHFRSKYASLSSCVDSCKEAFHTHNFALLQSNGHDEYGQYVETTLLHTTGERWSSVVYLVLSKADMQGLGSAITYARRYGLLSQHQHQHLKQSPSQSRHHRLWILISGKCGSWIKSERLIIAPKNISSKSGAMTRKKCAKTWRSLIVSSWLTSKITST